MHDDYVEDFMDDLDNRDNEEGIFMLEGTAEQILQQLARLSSEGVQEISLVGIDFIDIPNDAVDVETTEEDEIKHPRGRLLYLALTKDEMTAIDNALENIGVAKVTWSDQPLEKLRYLIDLTLTAQP